jgi:hypothetical protein
MFHPVTIPDPMLAEGYRTRPPREMLVRQRATTGLHRRIVPCV